MTWWRALGCALVLATAGCDGGNGDDFTDEANAVCAEHDASKATAAGERERVVVLAERARENEGEADALAEELGLGDCLIGEPRSP